MNRLTVEEISETLNLNVKTPEGEIVLSLDDKPWASMEEALADLAKLEGVLIGETK